MTTPTLAEVLAALKVDRGRTDPRGVVAALWQMVLDFPEHPWAGPETREQLEEVLRILRTIRRFSGPSDGLLTVELMALGKLGRFAPAVRRARQTHRDSPTWATAVAVGNALRRAGRLTAAAKMFAAAADLDPTDVTALLEVGDLALDAGRLPAALSAYERALGRQRSHAWAEPSAWYCRYALTGDEDWLGRLREAAAPPADACGISAVLDQWAVGYSDETRRQRASDLLAKAAAR